MFLLALLTYLIIVAVVSVAVVLLTSDRWRDRVPWLVQDDPSEER
jgi:hypothetical protein